jgi:hypothetical protein
MARYEGTLTTRESTASPLRAGLRHTAVRPSHLAGCGMLRMVLNYETLNGHPL